MYVANGTQGVSIIDVSNPASPIEVGSFPVGLIPCHITVSGNYVYVADRNNELHIVDIRNPAVPQAGSPMVSSGRGSMISTIFRIM